MYVALHNTPRFRGSERIERVDCDLMKMISVKSSSHLGHAATGAARPGSAEIRSLFTNARRSQAGARKIALIGTFAPRKCGIATFSTDIFEKLAAYHPEVQVDVYALDDPSDPKVYADVAGVIDCSDREAYLSAARAINESGVDAVWLQHEFGIYGGEHGALVCDLVNRLAAPLILTPHTVLGEPGAEQERILKHLVNRASRIMVMSRHSRDLLANRYGAPHSILEMIEHGAPDRPFGRQSEFKQAMGLDGFNVLTTFGLLGPGKGLERVIEALPAILDRHPDTIYRIVGATHPNLVTEQGERYREGLVDLAERLGVSHAVQWDNRFIETDELLDQLEACDIYVTPYPGMQQSTSGTLSYAVALGKAVVSTPYLHASELLANDVGRIVEPNDSMAIANAVIALLDDREEMLALQKRAYAKGRETIWPRFASAAAHLIESACAPAPRVAPLTATPGLAGLFEMTDGTDMLQHAIGIVPDRRHGYCLDDNVRALMLINVAEGIDPVLRARYASTYASFIQHAWNPDLGGFRNFMGFDRGWCEDIGSEDSNGRAIWALGQTIEMSPSDGMRSWAIHWYDTVLPHLAKLESPRAAAFVMLGAAARLRREADHAASRDVLERGADLLYRILDSARRPDWAWFEAVLGYDNPRLCQALIEAGSLLGRAEWTTAGMETLTWIAQVQTAASGHFRPIGSDSLGRTGMALPFDQQPLEALAAIEAAGAAYRATGDEAWLVHAHKARRWFFGANDRGVLLADITSGRCRDGITPRGANENCGAESILAFQLGHYSMLALAEAMEVDSTGSQSGRQHTSKDIRNEHALAGS